MLLQQPQVFSCADIYSSENNIKWCLMGWAYKSNGKRKAVSSCVVASFWFSTSRILLHISYDGEIINKHVKTLLLKITNYLINNQCNKIFFLLNKGFWLQWRMTFLNYIRLNCNVLHTELKPFGVLFDEYCAQHLYEITLKYFLRVWPL